MITIAALLTVYNRKEKTMSCLKELYNSFKQLNTDNLYSLDVYLTDDGCTDGTAYEVRKKYPTVNILKSKGDLFWNRGMINSWKEAAKKDYDFYVWLNDDTILFPNAFHQILSDYNKVKSLNESLLVGITQSINGKTTYGGRNKALLLDPIGTPQTSKKINGNFVLIPKAIFKKIGFLDHNFHHALGDHDYGLRALKDGFSIYLTSDYIGICEDHDTISYCFRTKTSLIKRFKHLYSPLGCNPNIYFYYDNKHFGFKSAVKHYFSIHLRTLLPGLWKL